MTDSCIIRPVEPSDQGAWRPLWDGYNAFYGRLGDTALPEHITQSTWRRFLEPDEPVFALVAQRHGQLVGLAHYLFHRSMTRVEDVCYLSDLFTAQALRGQGIGRALIHGVHDQALARGCKRVYWHTHESNTAGRLLYDTLARYEGFIVYSSDA
jgi:GNAT superfamily N-acetyltransferase